MLACGVGGNAGKRLGQIFTWGSQKVPFLSTMKQLRTMLRRLRFGGSCSASGLKRAGTDTTNADPEFG